MNFHSVVCSSGVVVVVVVVVLLYIYIYIYIFLASLANS